MLANKDKRSAIVGKKINVGGGEDPSYRYSVPVVSVQILPKGAYNETLINNLGDVVKSVQEFHKYTQVKTVLKFLGQSLSVGAEKNKGGIAKLRGEFSSDAINKILLQYFDLFVLCPKCMSPETKGITDSKRTHIFVACMACGGGYPICDEARNHKFFSTAVKLASVKSSVFKEYMKQHKKREVSVRSPRGAKSPRAGKAAKGKGKLTIKEYLDRDDPNPQEFVAFVAAKKPKAVMVEGVTALFLGHESTKDRVAVLKNRELHFSALILHHGRGGGELFVGLLTYLGSTKPKSLNALFSTAVTQDLVVLEHLQAWAKKPYATVLSEGVGVGIKPDHATLRECVKATDELLEYLGSLSDEESSSSSSQDEED